MKKSSLLITLSLASIACTAKAKETVKQPNVIIILTDDQGYEDLGCYGSPDIKTPNIDKMANDGIRYTNFYVSGSVSSASRAGLLTGRFNSHNGVKGVYFPDNGGLADSEITIAEALKTCGYRTACIGKWHLGDLDKYLPTKQGFDTYFGIPYSNDMFIGANLKISKNINLRENYTLEDVAADQHFVKVTKDNKERKDKLKFRSPLMLQDEVIEYPCDQASLTRRYFDKAIEFINESSDTPFFTYITPSMPHYPLFASDKFKGKSEGGLYGDAVEEIDWNVGRLMEYLDKKGLSENTIVIFASDNGPWLDVGDQAGSAGEFRDGKFSHYEGGVRVPCIIKWDGHLPKGVVSDNIAASIDFFPTIASYAGYDYKKQANKIDGINVAKSWENPSKVIRDEYLYVRVGEPFGIRKGNWIFLPNGGLRITPENQTPELYNIKYDLDQSNNLYNKNTKIAEKLKKTLDTF